METKNNEKTFVCDNLDTFTGNPKQINECQWNGLFGQQGWICPKCGRVYSPFTQMCPYCGNGHAATSHTSTQL